VRVLMSWLQFKSRSNMKKISLFISFFFISLGVYSQEEQCDSIFQSLFATEKYAYFQNVENKLQEILFICPDHKKSHFHIRNHYEKYYISIPIMALMWQNIAEPHSKEARKNIKRINKIADRYLTIDKKGTSIEIPEKFIRDWDADYENNVSNLETGFTLIGVMNHAPKLKSLNSAERMIMAFEKIFFKTDSTRINYHGFYWDFYVDYFFNLYKTEHFKTAIYLCMLGTKEAEITTWVNNNSQKIKFFYDWRESYLSKLKK